MTPSTIAHETLVFERSFACSMASLWQAFADPVSRARWGPPSPEAVVLYDEADFRIGGCDRSRCGSKNDPRFAVDVAYLDIQPERRIICSERIAERSTLLSCALQTIEFFRNEAGASIRITVQIASVGGADMAQGVREGMTAALNNLLAELAMPEGLAN